MTGGEPYCRPVRWRSWSGRWNAGCDQSAIGTADGDRQGRRRPEFELGRREGAYVASYERRPIDSIPSYSACPQWLSPVAGRTGGGCGCLRPSAWRPGALDGGARCPERARFGRGRDRCPGALRGCAGGRAARFEFGNGGPIFRPIRLRSKCAGNIYPLFLRQHDLRALVVERPVLAFLAFLTCVA